MVEDECHLRWGDTIGYGWGRRNERATIPIKNSNQRQTSYGVMNLYTQEVMVTPYERGTGANTVSFLKYLQALHSDKKLIIIWDGASYHCSEAVQTYVTQIKG